MEAGLTARVECRGGAARRFIRLMASDSAARPAFVEDVSEATTPWFEALEHLEAAEHVEGKGEKTLYLGWTVRDDEDARACLSCFAAAPVEDVWAVLAGDEGWYLLYTLREGKLEEHERWDGRSLHALFDGPRSPERVLDRLRGAA